MKSIRFFLFLMMTAVLLSSGKYGAVSGMAIYTLPRIALPVASLIRVPQDYVDLQTAINQVSDGGIIEISAGTYTPPIDSYHINDMKKGFTIRARTGDSVTINGNGNRALVRFINSAVSQQKPVLFEGLIFTNGYSDTAGLAAGVTLQNAEATFLNCQFINNNTTKNGAGGAAQISNNSVALLVNTIWSGNSAGVSGGAIEIQEHAKVYIHTSQFLNNRTNRPNHASYAAGGAIHIGNSTVRISNSRFEGNQAGYVGGAVYAIGSWNNSITTDVKISNSTFINNQAVNDPSVPLNVPTEGGAFHAEAKVDGWIYNSRFITNKAQAGGGVNLYRSAVLVKGSVFLGNQATGSGALGGGGGAINAGSNDSSNEGATNYPSATLTVIDTFIQGSYNGVTTVAQFGGGIFLGGDYNRTYGANGVSKVGTLASNQAVLNADRVAFVDLDTQKSDGGRGGAIFSDLGAVNITNSIFANCNVLNANSFGGAIASIDQSTFKVTSSTIVNNTATYYGGAIFNQGARLEISSSNAN